VQINRSLFYQRALPAPIHRTVRAAGSFSVGEPTSPDAAGCSVLVSPRFVLCLREVGVSLDHTCNFRGSRRSHREHEESFRATSAAFRLFSWHARSMRRRMCSLSGVSPLLDPLRHSGIVPLVDRACRKRTDVEKREITEGSRWIMFRYEMISPGGSAKRESKKLICNNTSANRTRARAVWPPLRKVTEFPTVDIKAPYNTRTWSDCRHRHLKTTTFQGEARSVAIPKWKATARAWYEAPRRGAH